MMSAGLLPRSRLRSGCLRAGATAACTCASALLAWLAATFSSRLSCLASLKSLFHCMIIFVSCSSISLASCTATFMSSLAISFCASFSSVQGMCA